VSRHLVTGRKGEDLAASYLKKKGLSLIEKNVTTPYGEIDLVCLEKEVIVFVEVKTRAGSSYGGPRAAVNIDKRRKISRSALFFLSSRGWEERPARFDVLGVILDGPEARFDHLVDAFDLTR